MSSSDPSTSIDAPDALSLVRNDLPYRLQRRIGLVPRDGSLGVARRALFWAAIAWLPIAVWAWSVGRALPAQAPSVEPLLQHFGVHVRLLLGIPLLIIAEAMSERVMARNLRQFVDAGIVPPAQLPRFRAILVASARLRDATLPWIVIVGLAYAIAVTGTVQHRAHELTWAVEGSQALGFGGWWYVYVSRPIFAILLFGWLWRLILLGVGLRRLAKLDLVVVPTHPDRAGGLGFLGHLPSAFSLVVFATAALLASGWGHDAQYHGLDVHSLYPMMAAALVTALVIFLAPYLVFVGPLARARREALLDYSALVGRHGAAVRRKWILGESKTDEPLLDAPEIGPVADTAALYESVSRMRPVPLGKSAVLAIAVPMLIPFIAVLAIQIPLKQMLQQLAKGLL